MNRTLSFRPGCWAPAGDDKTRSATIGATTSRAALDPDMRRPPSLQIVQAVVLRQEPGPHRPVLVARVEPSADGFGVAVAEDDVGRAAVAEALRARRARRGAVR